MMGAVVTLSGGREERSVAWNRWHRFPQTEVSSGSAVDSDRIGPRGRTTFDRAIHRSVSLEQLFKYLACETPEAVARLRTTVSSNRKPTEQRSQTVVDIFCRGPQQEFFCERHP